MDVVAGVTFPTQTRRGFATSFDDGFKHRGLTFLSAIGRREDNRGFHHCEWVELLVPHPCMRRMVLVPLPKLMIVFSTPLRIQRRKFIEIEYTSFLLAIASYIVSACFQSFG